MKLLFILVLLAVFAGYSPEPKTDFWDQYAKREIEKYNLCFQSQDYQYMKYHREMIKNLIEQGKYENEDSFQYDTNTGKKTMFYYTIGGYEFQKDGTLFGRKGSQL